MTQAQSYTLYYFHDPMCSWCWGFQPTWQALQERLRQLNDNPDAPMIQVKRICGGLAPDSDQPMSQELQQHIQAHWFRINQQLGTAFNHDFWSHCTPRRSTYPACRAVIAARAFDKEAAMIQAIQEAYYLNARNPSDEETLINIALELGLNEHDFKRALHSKQTEQQLQQEIRLSRQSPISGFPSLTIANNHDSKHAMRPIPLDYQQTQIMYDAIIEFIHSNSNSNI